MPGDGPVPKRAAERRRRNKPTLPIDTVAVQGPPVVAPPTPEDLHPIAVRWFESLKDSGQSRYYEPSDWAAAEFVATAITKTLTGRFSAISFSATWTAMSELLTTEGARRRARMEIDREVVEQEDPAVTAIADARKRLRA